MSRRTLFLCAGVSVLALTLPATRVDAWDSICYSYQDATAVVSKLQFTKGSRGCEGIEAARGRWRDPEHNLDEHRRVLELAVQQAGLPTSVLETVNLAVLTESMMMVVNGAKGATPSVDPRAPATAAWAAYRSFTIDELAQLPDFSYSLWDWARGNQTCPLAPLTGKDQPQPCHQLKTHMGAVNANHFPPQSDTWFAYYHKLAMDRATECVTVRRKIWGASPTNQAAARDGRFAPFFRACEQEALAYEAVAQHYLQDSWSAGHMWQRWGGVDLNLVTDVRADGTGGRATAWNGLDRRIRSLFISDIVALYAGTIHGSDAVVWEEFNGFLTLHDALSFPNQNVRAFTQGSLVPVVGDLHLHDLVGAPPLHSDISSTALPYEASVLSGQAKQLLGCSAGSVGAVYAALADSTSFGAPVLGVATAPPPPFDSNQCRAPQITNSAMYEGIDAGTFQLEIGQLFGPLTGIPSSIENRALSDYGRLRHAAWVMSKTGADRTDLAALQLSQPFTYQEGFCEQELGFCSQITYTGAPQVFRMLSQDPNHCYDPNADKTGCTAPAPASEPLAPFVDRKIPDPLSPVDLQTPQGALALAFHTAHAPALCDAVSAADLAALPGIVKSATTALAAACDACAEWTAPFLRIGQDANSYDKGAEPLCSFTSTNPANLPYVYEPAQGSSDLLMLARRHCGCLRTFAAATDAGLKRLVAVPSGETMAISQTGATVPVGALPRAITTARDGLLLVSNGSGQIVGVKGETEVDLDGNPNNGVTRLTFSGVSDLGGITVVNTAGKELLLAAAPGTGELLVWNLTASTLCDRVSVAQVAGQGAYDVVVTVDNTTVFVSLRKPSPLSGALASLNLPALARCDGSALATVKWLATPGAVAGLGPMALAPDGSKLAVGGRFATLCPDRVRDAIQNEQSIQVGCDRVFVLDIASRTWLNFGNNNSLPTRPGSAPYAVAWLGDSTRLAYASFTGVDNNGRGDSGWPANGTAAPRIPLVGTLRLGTTAAASFSGGGGGPGMLRNWTYSVPLSGNVIGPTVVTVGGAAGNSGFVVVGTWAGSSAGRVSVYPIAKSGPLADPLWEAANADPETDLHMSSGGAWYGGCSHTCSLPGGVCPAICPGANTPSGFSYLDLGAGVRALTAY